MTIPFSDFQKLDMRVGTIKEAERIEGSRKLVKLTADIGSETRQIIAGIGGVYAPENLIGRQCIFAVNLEPRMLMGLESQGMLLAPSDDDGKPVLLIPERPVEPGAAIH